MRGCTASAMDAGQRWTRASEPDPLRANASTHFARGFRPHAARLPSPVGRGCPRSGRVRACSASVFAQSEPPHPLIRLLRSHLLPLGEGAPISKIGDPEPRRPQFVWLARPSPGCTFTLTLAGRGIACDISPAGLSRSRLTRVSRSRGCAAALGPWVELRSPEDDSVKGWRIVRLPISDSPTRKGDVTGYAGALDG